MKIAISAESTIDMPSDLLKKFDINIVPFSVQLGEKLALDGEINPQEIFDYVKATKVLPKTSAVNEYQYVEHFEKLLKTHDAIIHFTLSKEMSCAYENAVKASKNFENVYIINSNSLSTGIALLAIYASELKNKITDPKEIVNAVEKRIPFVQASFVLEKLDYLRKGGRCSALQLFGANLLQLRPEILVENGKMSPSKKFRGNFENCVKSYCEDILNKFNTPDLKTAFVTFTTATETMVESAVSALKAKGFQNIFTTHAGATITSHCGEHCLGILYINDGNQK